MYDTLVKAWAHWGDYLENLFTRERSVIVLFILGDFYYYFIHQFVCILSNFSYTGASDAGDIAQWVKPSLNQIKPGLSGQNWVQCNNIHYVSSTFLPSDPICSKQYSALY